MEVTKRSLSKQGKPRHASLSVFSRMMTAGTLLALVLACSAISPARSENPANFTQQVPEEIYNSTSAATNSTRTESTPWYTSLWNAAGSIGRGILSVLEYMAETEVERKRRHIETMRHELLTGKTHSDIHGQCSICRQFYGPTTTRYGVVSAPGNDIVKSCGHVICNECPRRRASCPQCFSDFSYVKRVTAAPRSLELIYTEVLPRAPPPRSLVPTYRAVTGYCYQCGAKFGPGTGLDGAVLVPPAGADHSCGHVFCKCCAAKSQRNRCPKCHRAASQFLPVTETHISVDLFYDRGYSTSRARESMQGHDSDPVPKYQSVTGYCSECAAKFGPGTGLEGAVLVPNSGLNSSCGHVLCRWCAAKKEGGSCPKCGMRASTSMRVSHTPISVDLHPDKKSPARLAAPPPTHRDPDSRYQPVTGYCPECSIKFGPGTGLEGAVLVPMSGLNNSCGHVLCKWCAAHKQGGSCPKCGMHASTYLAVTETPISVELRPDPSLSPFFSRRVPLTAESSTSLPYNPTVPGEHWHADISGPCKTCSYGYGPNEDRKAVIPLLTEGSTCGHPICDQCAPKVLKTFHECPLCREKINGYRRVTLFSSDTNIG